MQYLAGTGMISRFALPVYDEQGVVERYNVYHVSMLVRHAKNGNYLSI